MLLREVLLEEPEVVAKVGEKIFPTVSTIDAALPYIVYRRVGLNTQSVNNSYAHDRAAVELQIYSDDYAQGVSIAESVRAALDGVRADACGLQMSLSRLVDASEDYIDEGDIYVQALTFEMKF